MNNPTALLTLTEFADRIGVSYRAICNYRALGLLPEPDKVMFRSPLWKVRTVDQWVKRRPGRGAGGGRPRKVVAE